MRVGIWCAYGRTLEATDGIGVFAHLLTRHLAKDPRIEAVWMLVHAGDSGSVAETVAMGEGVVRVAEVGRLGFWDRWRRKRLRWQHRRLAECLERCSAESAEYSRVESALVQNESHVAGILEKQVVSDPHILATPTQGGCDVWVLPHVSVERRFLSASVVLIHDMVPLREPGTVKSHDLASFRRRSVVAAERATLIGCMSAFIRDNDIVGLLGCPREKIRVVKPAVPDDIRVGAERSSPAKEEFFAGIPDGIRKPYLFYPAAFRPYKNHELLVQALEHCDKRGLPPLQLVFTGGTTLPSWLDERLSQMKIQERVYAVGRVERRVLEALYRNAAATVVPSRHEQGSFPVLEALACECLVAVSDIPSLREAFVEMGDSIPFFDPSSPASLADAVAALMTDPSSARMAQQEGFERLRRRCWREVTNEWIDVFSEAVQRNCGKESSS